MSCFVIIVSTFVELGVFQKTEDKMAIMLTDRLFKLSQFIILPLIKLLIKTVFEGLSQGYSRVSDLNEKAAIILEFLSKTKKEGSNKRRWNDILRMFFLSILAW